MSVRGATRYIRLIAILVLRRRSDQLRSFPGTPKIAQSDPVVTRPRPTSLVSTSGSRVRDERFSTEGADQPGPIGTEGLEPPQADPDVASTPSGIMIIGVISLPRTTSMWTGRSSDG